VAIVLCWALMSGLIKDFHSAYSSFQVIHEESFVCVFKTGSLTRSGTWHLIGVILLVGTFMLPYSPRWLVTKGRNAEALAALCKLRRLPNTDPRVQAEWLSIRAEGTWAFFYLPSSRLDF
jgi:hypothetical protein